MSINTNRWNRLRYTAIAPLYDRAVHFAEQRRRSLALLELRPGQRLLIPGIGTGADLPHVPAGVEVVGGDITPAMVRRARERAASLGITADIGEMDAQALPFASGSFDGVAMHLILAVVPDPVACIREAARVLRPGGRIVVFDKFAPDGRPPSLARRLANVVADVVATDITRQLGPLAVAAGLEIVHREPAAFGALFEIAVLEPSG